MERRAGEVEVRYSESALRSEPGGMGRVRGAKGSKGAREPREPGEESERAREAMEPDGNADRLTCMTGHVNRL